MDCSRRRVHVSHVQLFGLLALVHFGHFFVVREWESRRSVNMLFSVSNETRGCRDWRDFSDDKTRGSFEVRRQTSHRS